MNLRIKKSALFLIALGFILLTISIYFGGGEYLVIQKGEKIEGTVVRVEEIIKTNEEKSYRFYIWYPLPSPDKIFVTSEYSKNSFTLDQTIPLSLYKGEFSLHNEKLLFPILLGVFFGLVFFIWGLWSFLKNLKPYSDEEYLKLFGKRAVARFVEAEVVHNILREQDGYILHLESLESGKVFSSKPILDTRSIHDLERTFFDVYYNPQKPERYYIDLEKYFGKPVIFEKTKQKKNKRESLDN